MGPGVWISLEPLNTNDGFYLSHIPVAARGKDKNEQPHVGYMLAARRSVTSTPPIPDDTTEFLQLRAETTHKVTCVDKLTMF